MNWSDITKLFDVKGSVALAVAVTSAVIYQGAEDDLLHLSELPPLWRAIIAGVGILAGLLFIARLWDWIYRGLSEKHAARKEKARLALEEEEKKRSAENYRRGVLTHLNTLSTQEREILSFLIVANQRSFQADMTGGRAATLKAKGLVEMASGVHSQMDWPFTVPEFVWNELQQRKSEFNQANIHGRHPWRDNIW